MTPCRLLIAEDDPVLRELYARKFDKKKFTIRTAANGEETLQMLKEEAPDVLLLDINMPVMDGIDVMKTFSKENRTFSIIVLTNHDEQLMKDQMKELGADEYFVKKDMTLEALLEMTERVRLQPKV